MLSGVCIAALILDIWSGNVKEDYISVFAHFINVDWKIKKSNWYWAD